MITLKACAKINISLDIVGKREDGYHLLKTVMQRITLCDIIKMKKRKTPEIRIRCNKWYIPTDNRNIAYKTAAAFFERTGICGGVDIHILKHIPSGSGLGGGSADGAAVIDGLCTLYNVSMSESEKTELTENIGADIPFFFYGGTALCEGIGEIVTPIRPLRECWFVICKPRASLSTAAVFASPLTYAAFGNSSTDRAVRDIENGEYPFANTANALEKVAAAICPQIEHIKQQLIENGAFYAAMTGSGSAVFGVFNSHRDAVHAFEIMKAVYSDTFISKPCD